jgi:hypothetical protein
VAKAKSNISTSSTQTNISVAGGGAVMSIDHKGRTVPGYVIAETELDSISDHCILIDILFGFGCASVAFAVGLAKDVAIADKIVTGVNEMALVIYWICGIAAIGSFAISGYLWFKRSSIVKRIKSQSKI